jgi:Tol biopolymer transport system component/cell wall-associated NlpC family hydrolase
MKRIELQVVLVLSILAVFILAPPASAQSPEPVLVSASPSGEPGNGIAWNASVSADGRFVAYSSDATNLVPGDGNGHTDIFLFDRQTGLSERISLTPSGGEADGASFYPLISGNGRFIVYYSQASNLVSGDGNDAEDVFLFDRVTKLTQRISLDYFGQQQSLDVWHGDIDYAGRYILLQSEATLTPNDTNDFVDVYIYDAITGNLTLVSAGTDGYAGDGRSVGPAISGDGRIVIFRSAANNLVAGDNDSGENLFYYNRVLQTIELLPASYFAALDISYDGGKILFAGKVGDENVFFLEDRHNNRTTQLAGTVDVEFSAALSADGKKYAFSAGLGGVLLGDTSGAGEPALVSYGNLQDISANGNAIVTNGQTTIATYNIYLTQTSPPAPSYHLAGRVTDARGEPLALVTISDGKGGSTRTDAGGYFWLSGYPSGPLTLTPEKEGYTFEPAAWNLSVFRDVAGYHFTASAAEALLDEARLDLGMPYNFNRGCANGEEPCGGPYHGFHAGFCTDLILDAYTALNYDLNFELQQDAYAHPAHYYRWRNARNAHDMWRFLHYSGQMLAPDAAYLPGDIVFFDWSGDGEIDHVALVAAVENGAPTLLLDATGVTGYNPAGLAAEIEWLPFHTATYRGHARWDGRYQPVRSAPQAGVSALQMALGGGGIFIRLTDPAGRALSFGENSLPNGYYFDLDWEEVISVLEPAGAYTIEIRASGDNPVPYRFSLQTLTDGRVTGLITANGIARPLEVIQHTVQIDRGSQGELTLNWGAPRQQASVRGLLRKP